MILDQFARPISSPPAPVTVTTRPVASASRNTIGSMGQVFDAAKRGGYRGFFWFGSLDPADQMPEWTREIIAQKSNWLYNNVGAVRAVIDGLALDEVDTGLYPKPATSSNPFNTAVKAAFQQQCGFHRSFSADGEDSFYSGQYRVRREIRLRGELFGIKLRAGQAASCPQLQFVPSWQCRNADTNLDQSLWREGRMNNKFRRALRFRFVTGQDRKTWQDVDASDCIHFHDPFLTGQEHGMPELAPVIRKLYSIDDIERAETSGVLLRTRIAYAIERGEGDEAAPSLLPGAREIQTIKNADGTTVLIQKIVLDDDTEVEVADLSGGKKLKVIESTKSSESGSWIKELLTDVAYCTKYPPEYIFSLAGLTQGTLVRMVQQKYQRVVNTVRDFQIILQYVDEWWPFWLWQNISGGTFDNVRGGVPDEWWPYLVVRPKDSTVDAGREGRLYDDRVATGKMPWGLYIGMIYGEDDEEIERQIITEAYRRRRVNREIAAELNEELIPLENIFRPPAGGPQVVSVDEIKAQQEETDPPPPEPPKK